MTLHSLLCVCGHRPEGHTPECLNCSCKHLTLNLTEAEAFAAAGVTPNPDGTVNMFGIDAVPALGHDERPDAILCAPSDRTRIVGALEVWCSICKGGVWVAPSSQELLKRWPDIRTVCFICAVKGGFQSQPSNDSSKGTQA